jgi:hypothetical protein
MEIYPKDWRYRLTGGLIYFVTLGICVGALTLFGPMVGIHNGPLPVIIAAVVAVVLGNLVMRLLVRPPAAGPTDQPPRE